MKISYIFILFVFIVALSCSSTESLKFYHTPLNYLVETDHPLTQSQEQELREAAEAQLPEGVTIVKMDLVGETGGKTAMVLWMHAPASPDKYVKANYFDKAKWDWHLRK